MIFVSGFNEDLFLASMHLLGPIARKKNVMDNTVFYELMQRANTRQISLLNHMINHLHTPNRPPMQVFLTGPAGSGKSYTVLMVKEIYNRFTDNCGTLNAYIVAASTGKAAVAIDGTTIHTALSISTVRLIALSSEKANLYRSLFRYVKIVIIDECSMIGAQMLTKIDERLKQITGNHDVPYGGLDILMIGDLRQLPPVRATAIYKQPKQSIAGPMLWRQLQFYPLHEVMRQEDRVFSSILTKIGSGSQLSLEETNIIESRMFTEDEAKQMCPSGIRLFFQVKKVENYNNSILSTYDTKYESIAEDIIMNCDDPVLAQKYLDAFAKKKTR